MADPLLKILIKTAALQEKLAKALVGFEQASKPKKTKTVLLLRSKLREG